MEEQLLHARRRRPSIRVALTILPAGLCIFLMMGRSTLASAQQWRTREGSVSISGGELIESSNSFIARIDIADLSMPGHVYVETDGKRYVTSGYPADDNRLNLVCYTLGCIRNPANGASSSNEMITFLSRADSKAAWCALIAAAGSSDPVCGNAHPRAATRRAGPSNSTIAAEEQRQRDAARAAQDRAATAEALREAEARRHPRPITHCDSINWKRKGTKAAC